VKKSADAPGYVMQSVDHALRLLGLFAERQRLSVSEIGRILGVAPSTASRLVTMLEMHGFVQKDSKTRGYVVGSRLQVIGFTAVREFGTQPQVRPCLEVIAAETGETAQFGTLQGATVVFIDCVEGPSILRVSSRIGALFPAHAMATGKVLLASLPPEELDALYPRERLVKLTPRTLTTRGRLFTELDMVRRDGMALANGESEDGVYSLAVAISDALGRTRGAISVSGPATRMTDRVVAVMKRVLRREANELSARLL
jgi:DNA-binding IclR family transcriptional regulator